MSPSSRIDHFGVGAVIRWVDHDRDRREWGIIVAKGTSYYTVKNFKHEQKTVNINDHSIRLVRSAFGKLTPPQDIFLCDLNAYVNKLWLSWKAS